MHNISKTISEFIENQFPAVYREDGPILVDFIQAYYEFMEQDENAATTVIRSTFQNRDIDATLEKFVLHFKNKYLSNMPFNMEADKRFVIKHIMDFYRAKGTPRAAELLIRLLYNQEASVYYPGSNVLRVSDSTWFTPQYLEVSKSTRTIDFLDTQITGSDSGATAFVEGVVTKRIQGRFIDVVYLSQLKGNFITGELITNDTSVINSPKVIGSLSDVDIINGGRNNVVGDLFDVIDDTGRQGIARVTAVEDFTGRVDFEIVDGGSGYTINDLEDGDTTNDYTNIYVADAMLFMDNSNTTNPYVNYETIEQERELVDIGSAADVITSYDSYESSDFITGAITYVTSNTADGVSNTFPRQVDTANNIFVNDNGTIVPQANIVTITASDIELNYTPTGGNIVKVVDYDEVANGALVFLAPDGSSNAVLTCVMNSGTFLDQKSIDFANDAPLLVNELIYEEQTVDVTYSANSGSFANGEVVESITYAGSPPVAVAVAIGTVTADSGGILSLDTSFGNFTSGQGLTGRTSGTTAQSDGYSITSAGAIGQLTDNTDANTWVVEVVSGEFDVGNLIRSDQTNLVELISDITNSGATDVWYNGVVSANGLINTVTDDTVSGILVGQNSTCIGVYGNNSAFSFVSNSSISVTTKREEIREWDLVTYPDKTDVITSIGTGIDADFQIGSLEDEEIIQLNTDLIGGRNIANVLYTDIAIDGSNSGVGFLQSANVISSGNGYSNGTSLSFTGGGYAGGDPLQQTEAVVLTNGIGEITDIQVDIPGSGFYTTPSFSLPATGGSVANVELNMLFGYGFPKAPYANLDTLIDDALTFDQFVIGTISTLTRINPGSNYNTDPFVSVYNGYIAAFDRKNFVIDITITNPLLLFTVGELVKQDGVNIGIVIESTSSYIKMRRITFNTSLNMVDPIIGVSSTAQASVDNFYVDEDSSPMGDNAIITGTVITADGTATGAEIVDSGYGYLDEQEVILQNDDNPYIITATSQVETQGIGSGYWTTENSHIGVKKIHDNKYYQEYSYDIQTGISLDKYRDVVKKILHVAGTELFGTVIRNTYEAVDVEMAVTTEDSLTVE